MRGKHVKSEYKVAVITGASSGIGEAIAERFSTEKMKLVLIARRREKLMAIAKRLSGSSECHVIACDLADKASLQTELQNLPQEFKQIDVLVNSAGLALGLEPAQRASWQDWQTMIDINCTALAFITHMLLPGMVERNRGHIVNIGSIAGTYAYKGGNVYGASKAFVEQFSGNLKVDLLGTAVRVTNIEPGMVSGTEFSLVRFAGNQERAVKVYEGAQPITPESIAECVYWTVSLPPHVNICRIEVMPICQAPGGLAIHRDV
jgi:3-hydroxy acid dehydrogenase/malonic semialdehyde reductase